MGSFNYHSTSSSFTERQNHPPTEAPRRCLRQCGFFGSPENDGLCSKCYGDELKKKIVASEQVIKEKKEEPQIDNWVEQMKRLKEGSSKIAPSVAPKNRCGSCKKKVGLLGFTCRCGGTFCGMHRYAESHTCTFDFKSAGKLTIEKENPVVEADKLRDRA